MGKLHRLALPAPMWYTLACGGTRTVVRSRIARRGSPTSSQDASHGNLMGERRVDRFVLRVALRPAAYAKSEASVDRCRGDRDLRNGVWLRWAYGHPSLGRESPGLAGAVPFAPQRNPFARLHSATADRAQARGVSEVLPGLDHRRD